MDQLYKRILSNQRIDIGNSILVHIGHFKYTVGVGPIEIQSFRDGIAFGKELKENHQKKVDFRVLVDDIGIDSEKRVQIKNNFRLPKAYLEVLEKFHLSEDDIDIIFESSVRNYASRILSRQKVPGKIKLRKELVSFDEACEYERCVPQSDHALGQKEDREVYSVIDPHSGIPLILKEGANPKCNLIVACSYYKGTEIYDSIISFYNAIWEQRMNYGAMVARILFEIEKPIIDYYYYETNSEPKLVVQNLEELEFSFQREKIELVKKVLSSNIPQQLKDDYMSQLEALDNVIKLHKLKKDIINLCN
ncbi:MAG: hypothetical protein Q8O95_02950 [bacterium]|nr:hypothetical protein [bacterium]